MFEISVSPVSCQMSCISETQLNINQRHLAGSQKFKNLNLHKKGKKFYKIDVTIFCLKHFSNK